MHSVILSQIIFQQNFTFYYPVYFHETSNLLLLSTSIFTKYFNCSKIINVLCDTLSMYCT